MRISEKESKLIASGKLHAVLRWNKSDVEEKVDDILFSVDGYVYKLIDKKRWKLFRVAAQRSVIDFSCEDVYSFKTLITYLYKSYEKIKGDTVYLCIFKAEKSQRTLGL